MSTATSQCSCFEAGALRPCPAHPGALNSAPKLLDQRSVQISPLPRDEDSPLYLKGYRAGIEAALKLTRGKNADQ